MHFIPARHGHRTRRLLLLLFDENFDHSLEAVYPKLHHREVRSGAVSHISMYIEHSSFVNFVSNLLPILFLGIFIFFKFPRSLHDLISY